MLWWYICWFHCKRMTCDQWRFWFDINANWSAVKIEFINEYSNMKSARIGFVYLKHWWQWWQWLWWWRRQSASQIGSYQFNWIEAEVAYIEPSMLPSQYRSIEFSNHRLIFTFRFGATCWCWLLNIIYMHTLIWHC